MGAAAHPADPGGAATSTRLRKADFAPYTAPLTNQLWLMYTPAMTPTTNDTAALLGRFQAIAEETRFEIVRLLAGGERCVCELQDELDAAQSRLSFHLKKLKDAGVISDRRDGRWVYYSLEPEALEQMRAFLGEVKDECCAWDSGAGQLGPLAGSRGRAAGPCC